MVVGDELLSLYVDEYLDEETLLRVANIACERYATVGTDLHGFSILRA